jgi:hypothetical protein
MKKMSQATYLNNGVFLILRLDNRSRFDRSSRLGTLATLHGGLGRLGGVPRNHGRLPLSTPFDLRRKVDSNCLTFPFVPELGRLGAGGAGDARRGGKDRCGGQDRCRRRDRCRGRQVNSQWAGGRIRNDREITGIITQRLPGADLGAPCVFRHPGVIMANAVPVRPHPGSHGTHPEKLLGAGSHNARDVIPFLMLPDDLTLPGY